MALVRSALQGKLLGSLRQLVIPTRNRGQVYTESGAFHPRPPSTRFGLIRVPCMVLPFLYAGAMFSKSAAAFLEENDIFVPDDDDD